MPADAYANGLQLPVIPDELKSLNKLEKQLILFSNHAWLNILS
jgi:FMN phosphatase YigB (HAD superfamily)